MSVVSSLVCMATVRDNRAEHRYEIAEGDTLVGFADYTIHDDVITFPHTVTLPGNEGRGVARQLVEFALDDARQRQLAVVPQCWYVRNLIADQPDAYLDLVPADSRTAFRLPAA